MIGIINYLDILHYLVEYHKEHLQNYNFSIQDLAIGSYDHLWNVRENTPLSEGRFLKVIVIVIVILKIIHSLKLTLIIMH